MKKYQDILRDQTSRNFAAKDVNTSLLLLPLRLETKITNRNIETTDEAERVLYAFRALHDLLKSYYTLLSSTKTVDIEEKTNNVKQKIQDVICTFTKIDLLYTEDKAYLKDLVNNIYNTLHTVELQDAFAPVFDTFDDITRITSRSDKQITNLLNRFDRIVRSLEHTVRHPEFSGWRRMAYTNTYSQIARFRVAYRRYKEADKFLREIVDVVKVAPDNVTPSQCAKFERLVERLKKLIANAPEGNGYTILTHYYPLDNKKNDDQSDSDSTDKKRPASLYNKNEYYTRFTKMAQSPSEYSGAPASFLTSKPHSYVQGVRACAVFRRASHLHLSLKSFLYNAEEERDRASHLHPSIKSLFMFCSSGSHRVFGEPSICTFLLNHFCIMRKVKR